MTVQEAYTQLSVALQTIYDSREAANIANIAIEHVTGFANTSRIVHKNNILSSHQTELFQQISSELTTGKPLQYVIHEAWFYGMKLYVDEQVLIPRPETEELVEWILSDVRLTMLDVRCKMLDVGTGSGCIPVAIKKHVPAIEMHAADISKQALHVAKRNAEAQGTDIHFLQRNILDEQQWTSFPMFDYIISNPPYIAQSESLSMNDNVLMHEPHLALFVPDENPLLFYDAISSFSLQHLSVGGKLFFEINEAFGKEVIDLLSKKGYKIIELRKDLQGKDRMIKAEVFNS